jgi:hypothetical protein
MTASTKFVQVCLDRQDYYAFKKLSPNDLPDTYHEWADSIRKEAAELVRRGVEVEKITIGVHEFGEWCRRTGMPPDRVGREAFAVQKARGLTS